MTTTIHTGLLRHKAIFQYNTPVAMPGGGQKDAYTNLVTTRGYLEKLSGGRTLEASQLLVNNRWRFTCRFFGDLANNVNKTVRVLIGINKFTIDSWEEVDGKQFWYKFYLTEAE